jgi:hypothetical protein
VVGNNAFFDLSSLISAFELQESVGNAFLDLFILGSCSVAWYVTDVGKTCFLTDWGEVGSVLIG